MTYFGAISGFMRLYPPPPPPVLCPDNPFLRCWLGDICQVINELPQFIAGSCCVGKTYFTAQSTTMVVPKQKTTWHDTCHLNIWRYSFSSCAGCILTTQAFKERTFSSSVYLAKESWIFDVRGTLLRMRLGRKLEFRSWPPPQKKKKKRKYIYIYIYIYPTRGYIPDQRIDEMRLSYWTVLCLCMS